MWPEELVGRDRVGDAVPDDDMLPITYRSPRSSSLSHVVLARRASWHMASQLTGASVAEIGEVFGGRKAATVKPFLGDSEVFDSYYPFGLRPMSVRVSGLCMVAEFSMALERL